MRRSQAARLGGEGCAAAASPLPQPPAPRPGSQAAPAPPAPPPGRGFPGRAGPFHPGSESDVGVNENKRGARGGGKEGGRGGGNAGAREGTAVWWTREPKAGCGRDFVAAAAEARPGMSESAPRGPRASRGGRRPGL